VLRRRAAWAVAGEDALPAEIRPGEGLLGQAVRERRALRLDAVPDGYLRVGSGLGLASPRAILVMPVEVDGEVNAVLELGFAREVSEADLELLGRVSGAIGVAIRSAEYRARLRDLLEETQRQAEELQRQGEELRATNEELEASQSALEEQQQELERANAQLEERTRALEAQRAELLRSEAILQAQARELEQASRYKSEFLANMSHELRTPLNSSLIMARLLADNREGTLTAEQVRFAETIESSGNDLLALINDVLDLSKIEAGRVEVHPERVQLASLAERLRRGFEPVARDRGLAFRTQVAADAPPAVETDPQRLEQILRNFVSNALKFTEAGEVAVEVGPRPDGEIAFAVRDTGIGIAPDQQEVIFEAFRQADGTTSRRYGGTGLGLSISRELARVLGGRIELASAPGQGSIFTLVLPVAFGPARNTAQGADLRGRGPVSVPRAPAPTPPAPAPAAPPALEDDRAVLGRNGRVILVVEDDPDFARILRDLARGQGLRCVVARTADEGVSLARQQLPHAIILDIGLPDHTGLTVLDRLKHDLRTRHIPVHIVSAQDQMHTALAQGAVGYMLKPARREQLTETLGQLERRLDRAVRRVLVVEDDPAQLSAVRHLLAVDGVETTGAASGAECLARLAEMTFDCMVLDLALPDMSGFDLLDRLSNDPGRAFPPVIVYTGRDLDPADELRLRLNRPGFVRGPNC
jgi:signal transduction histidine kinase/DNA-binding response OmpR family regulator